MIRISIPYRFLNDLNPKKIKDLSYFLAFKKVFRNSTIYNPTYKQLRDLGICDPRTARKLFDRFVQHGWCTRGYMQEGDIHFKKINDQYLKSMTIEVNHLSQKEILHSIYLGLLHCKYRQCEYKARIVRNLKNPHNLKAYKAAKRQLRGASGSDVPNTKDFNISYIGMAAIWGCSKTEAFEVIQYFINKGLIAKRNQVVDTGLPASYLKYHEGPEVLFLNKSGRVIRQLPNFYKFRVMRRDGMSRRNPNELSKRMVAY